MIEKLTQLQYVEDPQAPYSIFVFDEKGFYDPKDVVVVDTAAGVARWLESDQAIRIINVRRSEVRIVDSGDMVCFHAKGGVVLYPTLDPVDDMAIDADAVDHWTKIPIAMFALRLALEDNIPEARRVIDQVPAIFEAANFVPFEIRWLDEEKNVVLVRSTPKLTSFFEAVSMLVAAGFPLAKSLAAVYRQMGITPYPADSPASRVFDLEKFAVEATRSIASQAITGGGRRKGKPVMVCVCKDPHCPVRLAQRQREWSDKRLEN